MLAHKLLCWSSSSDKMPSQPNPAEVEKTLKSFIAVRVPRRFILIELGAQPSTVDVKFHPAQMPKWPPYWLWRIEIYTETTKCKIHIRQRTWRTSIWDMSWGGTARARVHDGVFSCADWLNYLNNIDCQIQMYSTKLFEAMQVRLSFCWRVYSMTVSLNYIQKQGFFCVLPMDPARTHMECTPIPKW